MTDNLIDTVPPPGHFIREELEARGWSQRDLAYILGVPEQAVNMIISGKRGVSSEMAKALGEAFGVPGEFFANLQKAFDLSRAREPDPSVARRARLQSCYPVREMIKRGWLEDTDATMLEMQMARFFDVSKIDEIPCLDHAAKRTECEEIPATQLAWLFRVRQIAKAMAVAKYSEKTLQEALPRLHAFTRDPEEMRHIPRVLSDCGVRYVLVESLPNGKIDGVCLWLDARSPVIGLSLRHDRIDNYWFVLRHEIEHVLRGHGRGTKEGMVDSELEGERASVGDSVPDEERVANAAAAEFCVPQDELLSFIARKNPFISERDVIGFARRLQIHPGLVIGQIQSKTGRYDLLRRYLTKVRQFALPGAMVDGWGQVAPVSL